MVAETRHVGARRVRLRVVDLAVGVLGDLGRVAANLAELIQAGANGAVRKFFGIEFVASVAVTAAWVRRVVGELPAHARLGDALAGLPVAQILAVFGERDRLEILRFDFLGQRFRNRAGGVLGTQRHRPVLVQSIKFCLTAFFERRLHHRSGAILRWLGLCV